MLVAAVLTSACTGNLTCVHGKLVIFEQKMELCVISEVYNLETYHYLAMLFFLREPIEIWNAYYLNNFVFH